MGFVRCAGRQDDDRKSIMFSLCIDMFVQHMEQYTRLPCMIHVCVDSIAASCIVSIYVGLYVYSGTTLL